MFTNTSRSLPRHTSRRTRDGGAGGGVRVSWKSVAPAPYGTAVAAVRRRTTGVSSVIRLQRRPVCGLTTGLRQTVNKRIKNPTGKKKKKGHLLKIVRILGVVKTALPGVLNRGETTVPCASVRPRVCARTSFTYVHAVPSGIIAIIIIIIVIYVPARRPVDNGSPPKITGCPRPRRCTTLCPAA